MPRGMHVFFLLILSSREGGGVKVRNIESLPVYHLRSLFTLSGNLVCRFTSSANHAHCRYLLVILIGRIWLVCVSRDGWFCLKTCVALSACVCRLAIAGLMDLYWWLWCPLWNHMVIFPVDVVHSSGVVQWNNCGYFVTNGAWDIPMTATTLDMHVQSIHVVSFQPVIHITNALFYVIL